LMQKKQICKNENSLAGRPVWLPAGEGLMGKMGRMGGEEGGGRESAYFRPPTECRSIGRNSANRVKSESVVKIRIRWRTATAQMSKSVEVP